MTQDKARKRNTRARAAQQGDSYVQAHRTDPQRTPMRLDAAEVAPATIPAPVAVQMCRQLRAAGLHLAAWRRMAEDQQVLPERFSRAPWDYPDGPHAALELAHRKASDNLVDLKLWSERTAHASGASPMPTPSITGGNPGEQAQRELYPVTSNDKDAGSWCAAAGGRMPLPGETHQRNPAEGTGTVRHSLPGRVPDTHLTAYSRGRSVRPARDVVPGTPAEPIWAAHELLYNYASGWMDRRGDSPADLAAAVDGLLEIASVLSDIAPQIVQEIQRRVDAGQLTGVDRNALDASAAELTEMLNEPVQDHGGTQNHLYGALYGLRVALHGAHTTLPRRPDSEAVPEQFARTFNGRTVIELRAELGKETWTQRQMSKTMRGNYTRADQLEAMIQWMHATGAATYDAQQHRATATHTPTG